MENLKSDLLKVSSRVEELTQLKFKLLGAIEVLESLDTESVDAEVVKKDKK